MVEHSLGKGEVGSSILLCSTIQPSDNTDLSSVSAPLLKEEQSGTNGVSANKSGDIRGNAFSPRSDEARIIEAARWVSNHRDEIKGPLIAVIKERFGLKAIHAIEVAKRSANFEYANLTEIEYSIILLLVEYRELKITAPCEVIGRTLGLKLSDTRAALDGLISRHLIEYARKASRSHQARYKIAGGA